MTTVYKYNNSIISGVEAKYEGINTRGLEKASIEDCIEDLKATDPKNGYNGKIKVTEGVYEFDFNSLEYKKLN